MNQLRGIFQSVCALTLLACSARAALEDFPQYQLCIAQPETCTALEIVNMEVRGTIPTEIGLLTNLQRLSLYNSVINGSIPKEIGSLSKLTLLNVHNNYIAKRIPSEIGNLTSLVHFYAYSNLISGRLPSQLGLLTNLQSLYLSGNQIRGTIPSSYGNLTQLYQFSIHNNSITGTIPVELSSLTQLNSFYVSANKLNGQVPDVVWQTVIESNAKWSMCGNENLTMGNGIFEVQEDDQEVAICTNHASTSAGASLQVGLLLSALASTVVFYALAA